ncbi:MAG: 50S ribosomal protein L13 [Rhodospirillaceae bacterium]|jgi:large subunit ribosomal protein L13|nr:50S ribosomal protein L13 [Rhodospirillaceae bacterium]
MKTYFAKLLDIKKKFIVIDADGVVLGRLASIISIRLNGKHLPIYAPHQDCGDNVIVINAEKVKLTGHKLSDKTFYWHTGYPGGIKKRTIGQLLNSNHPERVIIKAVERMISHNPLGRVRMKNLHVYSGLNHPHNGQQPEMIDVGAMNLKNKRSI